tara:strand:+ start:2039 stop:2173 length:135 start_codon:yes stop_codon:yes gene_type:complete
MIGVLIEEVNSAQELDSADVLGFIFAPIVVPVLFGMRINTCKDE